MERGIGSGRDVALGRLITAQPGLRWRRGHNSVLRDGRLPLPGHAATASLIRGIRT